MLKSFIKKYFANFYWFFTYLRYKILIGVTISILVGVLDGFGLTLFLPLLQMVSGEGNTSVEHIGKLGFIVKGIESRGLSLNLGNVLLFMLLFFLLKGLAKYCSSVFRVILQQELLRKVRLKILNNLNIVSFKYFVTTDVGRIQNTMTGEVDRIQQAYQTYFIVVEQIVLISVYMSFAFFVDFQFALLVTLGGGMTNFFYKHVYKNTKGASKNLTDESNVYQGLVIQHVANFKYLRATGMFKSFSNRLENIVHKIEASRKKIGMLSGLLEAAREPLLIGVVAVVILIQVQVLSGNLGPILISLLFFYRALSSLTVMQNAWNRFLGVSGSLNNLQEFQFELKQNIELNGKIEFPSLKKGINLKNVEFNYGDINILKNISLEIHKNKSIAFVGESGSGKTTLINVLCGLLLVDSGEVLVDGIDLRELNRNTFQKRIGYITQEPVIFNDTIFNNVTFWAENSIENRLKCENALKKASVLDFIKELPEDIYTQLGNNGINLSGGQKQRISIARELYKDVEILIMDEATSALDSETEKSIQENIDELKGHFTILIVAHRLSTIKNVDEIVLMDQGKIIDSGSFSTLIKKIPNFRRMVELQEL